MMLFSLVQQLREEGEPLVTAAVKLCRMAKALPVSLFKMKWFYVAGDNLYSSLYAVVKLIFTPGLRP